MTNMDNRPGDAAELRRQAEEFVRNDAAPSSENVDSLSPEETRRTLHELRVHQIELEMQNEELRRAQLERDAAQARYFDLYDLAPVGYVTVNENGLIDEANLAAATLLGVARKALVKQPLARFILAEDSALYYQQRRTLLKTGEPQTCELRMQKTDNTLFWAHLTTTVTQDAEDAQSTPVCRVVMTDITERKRIEEIQIFLAQSSSGTTDEPFFNSLARYLAQSLGMDFVCIDRLEGNGLTARTVAVWCDGNFEDNVTYALNDTPCGDVVGKSVCCFPANVCQFFPRDQVLQDLRAESYVGVTLFSHSGQAIGLIAVIGRSPLANRSLAEATLKLVAVRAAGELERLDAEEEKAKLEDQLQQAQKMESVGRLAGGVAHDFNNMLQVILINAELATNKIPPDSPLRGNLDEIRNSAERSADLTRQLLAFARKQTIAPKVLDLNETVTGMLKMLQRLIGENIGLDWRPGTNLWAVNVDPSQIDQILANLCVNARDAIGDVGKITIETENAAFDEEHCLNHVGFLPGEYVRLAVSDTGHGMRPDTLIHVFEPFYTTKGVGEGTGLGLATVYGAVRQNNGFIVASSEPGHGATFTVYLSRHVGKAEQMRKDGSKLNACGHETILLVEDEPAVLKLTRILLEKLGYTVLAAPTPGDAIQMAQEHSGEIHLLMTDVIMPAMNGSDLARNVQTIYPNIQRLFMSGYTADIIASQGVLNKGVHFIQKPFSTKGLAAKIRVALDRE